MAAPIREGLVPWPADVARRYREKGYWKGISLGSLLWEAADRRAGALALVDGDVRLSYAELMARSDAAATRLAALGLDAGDRLIVQLPNSWHFVVLTLACFRRGVVPVTALPAHRRHELSYLAAHSEAVAIAVPDELRGFDHQSLAFDLAAELPELRHVLVAGPTSRSDAVSLDELCAPGADPASDRARGDAGPPAGEDVALFLLSGGTTGLPKLIARTHDDYAYNVRRSAEICAFDEATVYLGTLPASHNFPLACPGVLGTLLAGGRVVMLPSPEPERVFETIASEGVTCATSVPAVAQRWIAHALDHGAGQLATLRLLQVGGARLADELARQVRPVLGATLQQVFGMAEGLVNYTRLDDPDDVTCTTQGRPMCDDDEILIVDEVDQAVPDGQPGSLLTRGPYTPRGYYRAPEHNARAFTADGWYRSGDVVRRRPDGNLVVEGRVKDMINRGGEKISAEEVENLLYQLPGVAQVAAVATPDDALGERVCCYVVLRPGARLTLDEARAALDASGVARYKWPERLEQIDELPLTKVGKIDKNALREDLRRRATSCAVDLRHEVAVTVGWVDEGSQLLLEALERLSDDDLGLPTALPGWTRAHLLAHLARNAEALGRLLTWARTGVETPMYAGPAQRDADIEAGAAAPGMLLRAEVASSARALDLALSRFPSASWSAKVRSASGRLIPAAEIPWMRAREVWLHTVDLRAPGQEVVLPEPLALTLINDVCGGFDKRQDAPAFTLRTTAGGVAGRVQGQAGAPSISIEGTPSDLALWLTGRSDGARLTRLTAPLPVLPAWL
ncbi:MAG: AMP-binding protein [Acidimicrobiales bacterium]